jgi:hypothetical protein
MDYFLVKKLAAVGRPSGAQGTDCRPFDAMAESQICYLCGLLQFDPATRNA